MELGKNDKLKQKALQQETQNFLKVKTYIDEEKMSGIASKEKALETFGEPVIVVGEDSREKWVYKRAEVSWFGGEKIYLFFDTQGNLTDWQYRNPQ